VILKRIECSLRELEMNLFGEEANDTNIDYWDFRCSA
jgi:hypothetical protein